MKDKTSLICKELEELYPDKVVTHITNHHKLYRWVTEACNIQQKNIQEFLTSLGYTYKRHRKYNSTEDIIKGLEEIYPNKIYQNLKTLCTTNSTLYNTVLYKSKHLRISTKAYLKQLGFTAQGNIINLDSKVLIKLYQEYIINRTELIKVLGVTPHYYSSCLLCTDETSVSWECDALSKEEYAAIIAMIEKYMYTYSSPDNSIHIRLYKHKKDNHKFMIFYKNNDIVKCVFTIPTEIQNMLEERGYTRLTERDLTIKRQILSTSDSVYISKNKKEGDIIYVTCPILKRQIINRASYVGLSYKDYMNKLGLNVDFPYQQNLVDITLQEDILKYVNEDGYLHLPNQSAIYYRVKAYCNHNNYKSIKEFAESLGLKYKHTYPSRYVRKRNTMQQHVEMLVKYYVIHENKVYIRSNDPFYMRLKTFSRSMGYTLDEYINQLGYIRILRQDPLLTQYPVYDWRKEAHIYLK